MVKRISHNQLIPGSFTGEKNKKFIIIKDKKVFNYEYKNRFYRRDRC